MRRAQVELHGRAAKLGAQLAGEAQRAALIALEAERSGADLAAARAEAEKARRGEAVATREVGLLRKQRDEVLANYADGGLPADEAEALRSRLRVVEVHDAEILARAR